MNAEKKQQSTNLVDFLLNEDVIRVQQPADDWQGAVKIGIDLLVATKKAEPQYYDAIIRSVTKSGPYFVLMPGVALPHARPQDGALDIGFSLVTLQQPVPFNSGENDPISVLLSFCAHDVAVQLEQSLVQAVTLFEDEAVVQRIIDAPTRDEIVQILNELNQQG